jgi:D-arabinose 1-dehydrogenase-like Zn-dependent alcohol dehydrogenase
LNKAEVECSSNSSELKFEEDSMQSTMERKTEEATQKQDLMKALAVIPGTANTIHLREVPKPRVEDVPEGLGVLIKILNVGLDGTDKEINAAEYGAAPPGDDFLVTGHESLGQVVEVGGEIVG